MNKQILIALLAAVVALYTTSQIVSQSQVSLIADKWAAWKVQNGKKYSSEQEEMYRLAIFTNKCAIIDSHNEQQSNYKLGLNRYSDLNNDEMKALTAGYRKVSIEDFPEYQPTVSSVADSLNWVTKGAVTDIKDQGDCGSCWAFSTVGGIEGAYAIATGDLTSFSEQQINSCDSNDDGCNGGDPQTAFKYVNGAGLETEADYPYTSGAKGKNGKCKTDKSKLTIKAGQISGQKVTKKDKSAFFSALDQSPLSICIDSTSNAFNNYASGVIDSKSKCGSNDLDHCVTAVGYDNTASEPYVLVKNSWGTDWGINGYVKISSDNSNNAGICGIYKEPFLPIYKA